MNQREKFRSWWINSFSLLSPPYPQCLEHTHSNASCLIVPELLGHIVRHGDHLSRKNFYHFVLYSIKVLGLVKVKCHILSLDIVLLTWQRCLLSFHTFFALRQLGKFALWLIFKSCHINRDKNCSKFSTTFCIGTSVVHPLWHSHSLVLLSQNTGLWHQNNANMHTYSSFTNLAIVPSISTSYKGFATYS